MVREEVFEKGEEPFRNGALNQAMREMRGVVEKVMNGVYGVDEGYLIE